ncbi:ribbon-helix-helix protein, CopG family [Devosia sp.]|uniref:ribbon-helix-helix protein, CopG family n=1 Tax=Devosia sp. TaxID=1871048 RepID=UPI00387E6D50
MPSCDKRFEMRLPHGEKHTAEAMAQRQGITVSELLRRALRAYAGLPEPLGENDRISVAALRRRINAIEGRLGFAVDAGTAADLGQARADAQALLGR